MELLTNGREQIKTIKLPCLKVKNVLFLSYELSWEHPRADCDVTTIVGADLFSNEHLYFADCIIDNSRN
jgi:hypothetical protein